MGREICIDRNGGAYALIMSIGPELACAGCGGQLVDSWLLYTDLPGERVYRRFTCECPKWAVAC